MSKVDEPSHTNMCVKKIFLNFPGLLYPVRENIEEPISKKLGGQTKPPASLKPPVSLLCSFPLWPVADMWEMIPVFLTEQDKE